VSRLRYLFLTGPTASGKTALSLALAEWAGAEIVSMDSAIVYRFMDIGTAKPDVAARRGIAHHLIDIRDPEQTYSAGQFARDATAAIAAINARGRPAIVVGGTLLYLRALRDGLDELPVRDPAVRAAIETQAAEAGWAHMHAELARVDPVAAARIQPADRQRIQRALEVLRVTGRPLSEQQSGKPAAASVVPTIALMPPDREELRQAIAQRFDGMVDAGFVDEVRRLRHRPGLSAGTPSMRSVGYRQIWAHLDGACDWVEARITAITATRQLAKRQLTWLRSDAAASKLDSSDPAALDVAKAVLAGLIAQ
jgi:tRNA dimethylallyltransferase